MYIRTVTTDYMYSNSYIIAEDKHAIIIDVGDADKLEQELLKDEISVDYVILTHEHCDHVYGCEQIRNKFHCHIISSKKCDENLRSPRKNFSQYYNSFVEIQNKVPVEQQRLIEPFVTYVDETFDGQNTISWRGHSLYLRETPGHSPGSICILMDSKILFSGDTLFKDDETGTQFIGGSKKKLLDETLPWLRSLPSDIQVYPGHGEVFDLSQRLTNI